MANNENLVEFACPNCSSELNYDAEKKKLKCLHCQSVFEIENSNELIAELALNIATVSLLEVGETSIVYKCSKCGKENTSANSTVFFECSNCGNNVINTQAYKQKAIHPSAILPFTISKTKANDIFKTWIGKGFWNESALKHLSLIDYLKGHYIPFWTFDAKTINNWAGNAGYYYTETEYYTDGNGNRQSRSVTKTRWQYHEGTLEYCFDDILICGNKSIVQENVNGIYPFELEHLVPLNEKYILGWNAEAYNQNVAESFEVAKAYIKDEVYNMCSHELGGDVQSGLTINTNILNETYKHLILPVWLCEYLYKGKKYSFIINGQTGKIDGHKPISTAKIVFAIVIAIIVIAVIYYFSQSK